MAFSRKIKIDSEMKEPTARYVLVATALGNQTKYA